MDVLDELLLTIDRRRRREQRRFNPRGSVPSNLAAALGELLSELGVQGGDPGAPEAGNSLLKSNNLSDLDSIATALHNLNLDRVNNTSDVEKPVSTATASAISSAINNMLSSGVVADAINAKYTKPAGGIPASDLAPGVGGGGGGESAPVDTWTPADRGFKFVTVPSEHIVQNIPIDAGVLFTQRIKAPDALSAGDTVKFGVYVLDPGSGGVAHCYFMLFDGVTRAPLWASNDLSASWGAGAGLRTMTGQISQDKPAGNDFISAILVGTQSSDPLKLGGAATVSRSDVLNGVGYPNNLFYATSYGSYTSPPALPSTGSMTPDNRPIFVARLEP